MLPKRAQIPVDGPATAVALPARRITRWLLLVLAMVAALVSPMAPHAAADPGLEQAFVDAINAERAAAGLDALTPAGDLTELGRRHSTTMADADHLHHNPSLAADVSGWRKVGENVGRGPAVDRIHDAFMASASHRRNVIDAEWTEVGVGVIVRDGQLWVTEVFRDPAGTATAASEPAADPAPEADAEPASEPTDEPAEAPAEEPAPEPVDEPVDEPIAIDRFTLTMAKEAAADLALPLDEVLGTLFDA